MRTGLLAGAAAGAAGTAALNAVTYLDMAVRGRPGSTTPEQSIESLPVSVPGDEETRAHRVTGLASLSGIVTGAAIGAAFGLLRRAGLRPGPLAGSVLIGATAMAATNLSMAAMRVTDPRDWSAADWLSDALPHLAYGATTDAVLRALDR
ncbi:hypothetical protein Ade02nite_11530 [Paractinoplanes deccanensis]|uniref:DUF1440 domain-containing protein n=1 Tax=Paractinoplanes deccanensis TaxID=113561 RepID=A0ABQ3XXP8_9ACTN|nr:hypothetical protein [Actinoplanes deccanensis]GID72512.1 hypothetical protein Ade02nite_11530 [Actinoplanes deccanensis]